MLVVVSSINAQFVTYRNSYPVLRHFIYSQFQMNHVIVIESNPRFLA